MKIIKHSLIREKADGLAVGSQIFQGQLGPLLELVEKAIPDMKFDGKGCAFHILSDEAAKVMVSAGCHNLSNGGKPKAILHRGETLVATDRDSVLAKPAEGVAVIVYNYHGVQADGDLTPEEKAEIGEDDLLLVDVLGFYGPPPVVSSHRLIRNLGGGNSLWDLWDVEEEEDRKKFCILHDVQNPSCLNVELTTLMLGANMALGRVRRAAGETVEYEQTFRVLG